MGVISEVDKPTQWCAGIVVVPKKAARSNPNLCRPQATERACTQRSTSIHDCRKWMTHWLK